MSNSSPTLSFTQEQEEELTQIDQESGVHLMSSAEEQSEVRGRNSAMDGTYYRVDRFSLSNSLSPMIMPEHLTN